MARARNACQRSIVRLFAWHSVLISACAAGPPTESSGADEMLPLSAAPVLGISSVKQYWSRPISWQGREYEPHDAIPVVVRAVLNDESEPLVRQTALTQLDRLGTHLGGTRWIAELIVRYHTLSVLDEKAMMLRCLLKSGDPRAFSLFHEVLETAREPILRLRAAIGLANWNVRRGVRELIELFPSRAKTSWLEVGVLAGRSFGSLNRRKAWGCPEDEIRVQVRASLAREGEEAAIEELMRAYREWFRANEHRFPEWKPGDPLPEVPEADADTSDE